jgi:threonyl-tRNA synthetase
MQCRPDQIKPELHRFLQMLKVVYDTFGLHYKMALSTRPQEKLGDDAMWDQAEGALQGALDETGLDWEVSHLPPWHANALPLLNTSEHVQMQDRCINRRSNQKLHHNGCLL